jgi:hypothetical protein
MELRTGLMTAAAVLLFVTACSKEPQPAASPSASASAAPTQAAAEPVGPLGWGALRIGMTRAEVEAVVGPSSTPPGDQASDDVHVCDDHHPQRAPEGLFVMLEDDKLTRITLYGATTLRTAEGIGLGDTAAHVKEVFGARARSLPHRYDDAPAEYIQVWEGAGPFPEDVQDPAARGVVFETDHTGKVTAIHAGGPSIQYIEGCA